MRRNRIAAIDVGTSKVCTIMADVDDSGVPRILGVGITPSHGLQKGAVVNINEAKVAIRESVRKAEQIAGFRIESAIIGITGRNISSTNNRGVVAITRNDQLVRSDDLRRVMDVAKAVKVPGDQKLLHVIPRDYNIDGQEGVKNPVGMHGFRLDVETHIISMAQASVQNLVKCIRGIGVDIEELVFGPLASAAAVLTQEERENGVLLADIGGGTTDIALYRNNSVYHTSILPVAGYQITHDIAVGLGLSFEMAEEVKRRYGNVLPNTNGDGDRALNAGGHSVNYGDMLRILRIRTEEMLRLVILELPQGDYASIIPAGIVLTGGSANIPGLSELAAEVTHMPVRIGTPSNLYGIWDALCDPAYATAVGLLVWKLNFSEAPHGITQKATRTFTSRMSRLFS